MERLDPEYKQKEAERELGEVKKGTGEYNDIIHDIEELPHFREFWCVCENDQEVHAFAAQVECKECKKVTSLRDPQDPESQIQSVVEEVLSWIGEGEALEAVIQYFIELRISEERDRAIERMNKLSDWQKELRRVSGIIEIAGPDQTSNSEE